MVELLIHPSVEIDNHFQFGHNHPCRRSRLRRSETQPESACGGGEIS